MITRNSQAGIVCLALALLLATVAQASTTQYADLSAVLERRLSYMKDVAAYKWRHGLAIENPGREEIVLASAVNKGLQYGLTTQSSRRFFTAQINAAKEVQRYWFARWQQQPELLPNEIPDLDGDIRPALIDLGDKIIEALATRDGLRGKNEIEGLSQSSKTALSIAAQSVTVYPDRLTQIRDSGQLRVGTTGDYAPFSSAPGGDVRVGIDIDLAENLAHGLGVEVKWVQTSWPNLMKDFHAGLFDIGMSGISINPVRQQTAFFSLAYHRGGKTPIIRCADQNKYSSLDTIDRVETRLVVNPGGTNAQFVENFIKHANVRIHFDNTTIFDEIIAGHADVMITDLIEVRLHSAKHPELCAALGTDTLSFSQKGFLLPQDIVWKEYVDEWLTQRIAAGHVKNLFTRHLSGKSH